MIRTFEIRLNNQFCRRCANTIKTDMRKINGVKTIEIDFERSQLNIEYENDNDMRDTFMKVLSHIGLFQNNKSCEIKN